MKLSKNKEEKEKMLCEFQELFSLPRLFLELVIKKFQQVNNKQFFTFKLVFMQFLENFDFDIHHYLTIAIQYVEKFSAEDS